MNKIFTRIAWGLMVFFAIGIAGYASMYLNLNPDFAFLQQKPDHIISRLLYRVPFWLHVFGGILALTIGPFQFHPGIRKKRMKLHRSLGKIYVGAILMAGLSGIPVSLMAEGGWIARIGFLLLALTWLYTTGQAYVQIRQRNIEAHKRWMRLSYATTFAAVTLRIWLPLLMGIGLDFPTSYATVAWLCWVPNLIVVELVQRKRSTVIPQELVRS